MSSSLFARATGTKLAGAIKETEVLSFNYKHPTFGFFWGNGSIEHTDAHKLSLEQDCGKDNYETHTIKCVSYKDLILDLKLEKLNSEYFLNT